jgi:undecaprenyl-diphosphatase
MNQNPSGRGRLVAATGVIGFILIAVLVSLGITLRWDEGALLEMARFRTPVLTSVMQGITTIGGGDVLAPVGLLFGAWLWFRRSRRVAGHYLGAAVLGWGCYGLLKWVVARPRPAVVERLDGAGWWSFPSGHAMASVIVLGLAVVLLTQKRRAWAVVGLLLLLIAFSRVYLGVHYPSDVIAGLFGGMAWVGAAVALLREGTDRALPGLESDTAPGGQTTGSVGGQ